MVFVLFISSSVSNRVLLQKHLLGRDSYIWKTNGGLNHTKVDDAIGFEIGRKHNIRETGGYHHSFMAIWCFYGLFFWSF